MNQTLYRKYVFIAIRRIYTMFLFVLLIYFSLITKHVSRFIHILKEIQGRVWFFKWIYISYTLLMNFFLSI